MKEISVFSIDKYVEEYFDVASTHSERTQVMRRILNEMGATEARFLRHDYCTKAWYEVSRKQIVEKVGTRRLMSAEIMLSYCKISS